jgi:hypothetical protein
MNERSGSAAETFIERFTAWSGARRDIRGALVVGSRARSIQPADALSDIDLMVVTRRPRFYASTRAWLGELGEPVLACNFSSVVGTRPVLSVDFDGDVPLHVDFAIVGSFESRWASVLLRVLGCFPAAVRLLPAVLAAEIASWFDALAKGKPRILVDKLRAASWMSGFVPRTRPWRAPRVIEWAEVVNSFLSLCLWQSKLLLRGDRWMALQVADRQMKDRLLQMLEWHARGTRGSSADTWYTGRFLETWAAPEALRLLPATFARNHDADAWRSIFASLDLFARLGGEAAPLVGATWPEAAERRVRAWLERRFEDSRTA